MTKITVSKLRLHLQWWLVVIVLVFSTIAFGGINPQTLYLIRLLVLFSFLLQIVFFCLEDHYLEDLHPAIYFPVFIFILFLVLVYLQYFFGLKILQNFKIGTVNCYSTYDALLQLVVYFMFFITCLKIAVKRQLVERLASMIVVFTFLIAILGLAQRLITSERILWRSISFS